MAQWQCDSATQKGIAMAVFYKPVDSTLAQPLQIANLPIAIAILGQCDLISPSFPICRSDTYTDFLELEKEVGGHGMQVSCSIFASQVQFF